LHSMRHALAARRALLRQLRECARLSECAPKPWRHSAAVYCGWRRARGQRSPSCRLRPGCPKSSPAPSASRFGFIQLVLPTAKLITILQRQQGARWVAGPPCTLSDAVAQATEVPTQPPTGTPPRAAKAYLPRPLSGCTGTALAHSLQSCIHAHPHARAPTACLSDTPIPPSFCVSFSVFLKFFIFSLEKFRWPKK